MAPGALRVGLRPIFIGFPAATRQGIPWRTSRVRGRRTGAGFQAGIAEVEQRSVNFPSIAERCGRGDTKRTDLGLTRLLHQLAVPALR
jgi:hypothetical protein